MTLRQRLEENPRITTVATVIIVAVFMGAIIYSMYAPGRASAEDSSKRDQHGGQRILDLKR